MRQYNNIIKLRAIENRSSIIKASNSGESLHINSAGRVIARGQNEFNLFNVNDSEARKTIFNYLDKGFWLILYFILISIDMLTKVWNKVYTNEI